MSSSAATTPCRGAMKPALTPTVVVTPSASTSELSPSMMSCSNVSSSLTMSTSKYSSSEPPVLVRTLCLVGRDVQGDKEVVRASDKLGVSVIKSETGQEHVNSGDAIAFVVHDFIGSSFDLLRSASCTIFGPTAVKEAAAQHPPQQLVMSDRPLFATSMRRFGVYFHGYNKHYKEDVRKYLFWINSLGGSVVPKIDSHKKKVTHLVARHCRGQDYTYASTFDIPILQDRWLAEAWERRYEMNFSADRPEFQSQWKVKPFHGAYIHFLGFPEEERVHMVSELARNGGRECADYRRERCTHVVVDGGGEISSVPADVPKEAHVVKVEWFWASIQMDACAQENLHLFSEYVESFLSPARNGAAANYFSPTTPGSHGRRKKRRTEALKQLAQSEQLGVPHQVPSTSKKSRSSVGDLGELCGGGGGQGGGSSGSFLDTPDKHKAVPLLPPKAATTSTSDLKSPAADTAQPPPPSKKQLFSARQQVFAELLQTEENYVGILNTILEVFRDPLEKTADNPKMQLLNQTQIKIIFGNVPPLLDVHSKMLAEFRALMRDWREAESSVGTVLLRYAQDLMRAYPPFVNFFENTKRTLEECDKANPRFHAFLKVCQSRRECGRQTLAELLIRPVQRLGSVCLLLNDLLKHTRKERDHPDAPALESALGKIKEVLTNINEDKRKTEGQVHIFEIFSDIENCPPHLVSSNRNFLCKADVVELGGSDELSGKGSDLSLFLFNDVLEISKKRRHYQNSGRMNYGAGNGGGGGSFSGVRSPSTLSLRKASVTAAGSGSDNPGGGGGGGQGGTLQRGGEGKLHKHINLMSLTSIRRVVDLDDGEESRDCFALICRTNQELKERMFVFQFISSDCDNGGLPNKEEYLRQLCRNIANTMYRPDPDAYLVRMRPDDLGLTSSDLTASRNYRSMYKVKKVFSFNRTPTTSRLTRAVSSMISPLTSSNGGHTLNNAPSGSNRRATPSGDLQNLKLQSCTNLATAGEESPRSTRNYRTMTMCSMPPPASPSTRSVASSNGSTSDAEQHSPSKRDKSGHNQFALPRTPNFVSRRSSFKFLSSSLGKKF